VKGEGGREVDIGDDVAVVEQNAVRSGRGGGHVADAAARAEDLALAMKEDRKTAALGEAFDIVGEMVQVGENSSGAGAEQLACGDLEERRSEDGEERFRKRPGEREHPFPAPGGEYHPRDRSTAVNHREDTPRDRS